MKSVADLAKEVQANAEHAAKRARWKRNAWCRHWDGFCDRPIFRLVAERVGLPLYQVIAFAMRLDELANRTEPRGSVSDFSAAEFAVALGMSGNETGALFADFCAPEVGYIAYGHIADFYDRNRDTDSDKEAAKERKRRQRGREEGLDILARLARRGEIGAEQRTDIERELQLRPAVFANEDFFKLLDELRSAELSTARGHRWSQSDRVTVTQEQIGQHTLEAVDNSGTVTRGEGAGLLGEEVDGAQNDPQAQARQWIAIAGRRIAIARMADEQPGRVDTLLERWRDQDLEGDAVELMTVLIECDRLQFVGASFHVEVTKRCSQARQRAQLAAEKQPGLPLGGIQRVKRTA